ncbi:MAG: DUF433 domain-containing protein [Chloroflexota bacterium]
MLTIPPTVSIPLSADDDGVIRVGKTRVILDLVIYAIRQGATPETIVEMYPSLSLPDVYFVTGYYLQGRHEIDTYIAEREAKSVVLRQEIEKRFPQEGIRERLLARLENQKK